MRAVFALRTRATPALFILGLLVAPSVVRGQEVSTRGYVDPALMRTPTGMLYSGGALEVRPDGRMGLAEFPVVTRVDSGSVSWRGGLRVGDVLLAVNGRDARDARPFRRMRGESAWRVRVRRAEQEQEITIEYPPPS